MIISGPKQPGKDIDVFLEPVMEDMKVLWEDGVKMMDVYVKRIVISPLTSMRCIGCCGTRTSMSHKSPFCLINDYTSTSPKARSLRSN